MVQAGRRITIFTEIRIVILSVLLFFLFPILLILLSPIYVYRYLVYMSSKAFKPELGKILNTKSTVFATDDMYGKPRATLVTVIYIEGDLELEECRSSFGNILQENTPGDGSFKHPELRQYVSSWMGFLFWKWDPAFHINNHIRYYDGNVRFDQFTEDAAVEVGKELITIPWAKGRSPWELLLIPNSGLESEETPGVPKSAVMFRTHHSLADGYSIVKLLVGDIAGQAVTTAQPSPVQKSLCRRLIEIIVFIFRAPYDFVSDAIVKGTDPIGPFHLPEAKLSRQMNIALSQKIPLSYVKEIRSMHKASFAGVIMTAFGGALRNLMLERGLQVPEYISVLTPLPFPGHPEAKLRNHLTVGIIRLPVGISDPELRLRAIEAHFAAVRRSTFPVAFFWLGKLMGGLLACMTRVATKQYGPSAVYTNFPAQAGPVYIFGQLVLDCILFGGQLPGNIGIGMASVSYNGNFRLTFGVDENMITCSEMTMDIVIGRVLDELELLKQKQVV